MGHPITPTKLKTNTQKTFLVKPLEPRTDMNNAVLNQSFLALAYYKDPAQQLLSSANPLPPPLSDQGSYTSMQKSGRLKFNLTRPVWQMSKKCGKISINFLLKLKVYGYIDLMQFH